MRYIAAVLVLGMFAALAAPAPAQSLTSISPPRVTAGSAATTVTVTGTGFIVGKTTITAAGQTGTVTSPTTATVTLPATALANAGTIKIVVDTGLSLTLIVALPSPTITLFAPTTGLAAMGADRTVTVTGTKFVSGTSVTFGGGQKLQTTFVSPTSLTAVIPAAFMGTAGKYTVGVENPDTVAIVYAADPFVITNPAPILTSVSPMKVPVAGPAGTGVILTLTGVNFNNQTAPWIGEYPADATARSYTEIKILVPASMLQKPGTWPIVVKKPQPGGGTSQAITFQVGN
jgi:hypothetical protein